MAQIDDFQGMQYARDSTGERADFYTLYNKQYATTSKQIDHDMFPDLIIQPTRDEDVMKAVRWARKNNAVIVTKSGGHQYSGASSTGPANTNGKRSIQIDLTDTYKERVIIDVGGQIAKNRALVYVGVSVQIQELNEYLARHKLFVPHGQCAYVCVGGHGQTGGYGQLGRSFGLFGDHIRTIHLVCHDGAKREISKQWDPELFYAILGGSPGNFGIITHYTVEVFRAQSYMLKTPGTSNYLKDAEGNAKEEPAQVTGPYGIKGMWVYKPKTLKKLLTLVAQMGDNKDLARNFDLCVSVLSRDFPITKLFPRLLTGGAWTRMFGLIKDIFGEEENTRLAGEMPATIVVYAQWCPVSDKDEFNDDVKAWFQQILDLDSVDTDWNLRMEEFTKLDMADMTGQWVFRQKREFDLPYIKRTYATSSRTLEKDKWADKVVESLNQVYLPKSKEDQDKKYYDHCKLAVQIQAFGGDNSRFYGNRNNGTSYSWRDSTVVQTMDCFHEMDKDPQDPTKPPKDIKDRIYENYAEEWQKQNDERFVGSEGCFSKEDKRLLWGSYGDWDLSQEKIWKCYYEDEEKYQRLGRTRGRADPAGTFTANPFAVTAIREVESKDDGN